MFTLDGSLCGWVALPDKEAESNHRHYLIAKVAQILMALAVV
jgi:hypothetical protein